MLRSYGMALVVGMILALAGCKAGIQVQDNTYDALGGQVIKVSDDFAYVGTCSPTYMVSVDQGRYKANNGITTRGDVFVRSVNGQPAEVFIIQRNMITKGNGFWNPVHGTPVDFYGKTYKEGFFDAKTSARATVQSYMDFLNSNGFKVDAPDLYVRAMTRTVGRQLLTDMYYGVYPGLIPEDMRGDGDKERAFIRNRFEENITVVQ